MTRADAVNKLAPIASSLNRVALVDALEALGLIKFDEPKAIPSPSELIYHYLNANLVLQRPMHTADQIVNTLMQNGYKIVKA